MGLGLTHSTSLVGSLLFKAYAVIPFVEELRVLTDWTVTKTSLDFFVWMKLEDMHHNLYKTTREMLVRRMLPPAAPRDRCEKVYQGGLLLLALIALVIGPIAFFSTLNGKLLKTNKIHSAKLSVNLAVEAGESGIRTTMLYNAGQEFVTTLTAEEAFSYDIDTTDSVAQRVRFPIMSDNYWLISPSLREQIGAMLQSPDAHASIEFDHTFHCDATSKPAMDSRTTQLSTEHIAQLQRILSDASNSFANSSPHQRQPFVISVPYAFTPQLKIDSEMHIPNTGEEKVDEAEVRLEMIVPFHSNGCASMQSVRHRVAVGNALGCELWFRIANPASLGTPMMLEVAVS